MAIPEDRQYTHEHLWLQIEDGVVTIGLTDRAAKEYGAMRFVELPDPEDDVLAEVALIEVETDKQVVDLYCPFDGVVVESHAAIEEHPEYIEQDPYGKGWLVKVRIDAPGDKEILSAEEYKAFLAEKK